MPTPKKNLYCAICNGDLPRGRVKYCDDACASVGHAQKEERARAKRLKACARCGAPKERGRRGGRLCPACIEIRADVERQMDRERHRRQRIAEVQANLEDGKPVMRHAVIYRDGEKWCPRCQQYRAVENFPERKDTKKRASYCRPCQKAYNSERRLKIQFGLDWDEYDFLLAAQGGRCAICDGRPRKHLLAVDHDHKTGEIRGLLCSRCNHKLLGSANDDPARLRKAADYLEQFGPRDVFGEPRYVPGTDL